MWIVRIFRSIHIRLKETNSQNGKKADDLELNGQKYYLIVKLRRTKTFLLTCLKKNHVQETY